MKKTYLKRELEEMSQEAQRARAGESAAISRYQAAENEASEIRRALGRLASTRVPDRRQQWLRSLKEGDEVGYYENGKTWRAPIVELERANEARDDWYSRASVAGVLVFVDSRSYGEWILDRAKRDMGHTRSMILRVDELSWENMSGPNVPSVVVAAGEDGLFVTPAERRLIDSAIVDSLKISTRDAKGELALLALLQKIREPA